MHPPGIAMAGLWVSYRIFKTNLKSDDDKKNSLFYISHPVSPWKKEQGGGLKQTWNRFSMSIPINQDSQPRLDKPRTVVYHDV